MDFIGKYGDMLDMEHPVSKKHPQMSMLNRAAQFSPFAALTGFEEEIHEGGRLTASRISLDENRKNELDEKLSECRQMLDSHPLITVRYFVEDEYKEGGEYVTVQGSLKKIDDVSKALVFTDGRVIYIDDIYEISR